ncbi:MAG: type II secretion system protein [Gammaproteobacteria bacterium]
MNARRQGFSLMEMLMVLLVIALITLSFFTLKQSHMEVDKAEDLGYRLFEYGQALGQYLRTEGKGYPATGPDVMAFEGYEWLKEKGYLNKEFSLAVEPLFIENVPGKTTPLYTEVLIVDSPTQPGTYDLMLDMVEVGPVYSRNDVKTDEAGNRTYVQDVSLIARAVNYANEYRDTIKGSGVIHYRRVEIGNEQPPAEPPPGEPPPPAFATPSIIQGTMTDQSMWNDAWLLRSGNNTMQGPITFETAAPQDSAIKELDKISFKSGGSAGIDDLKVINFSTAGEANGSITGIGSIDFSTAGVGAITGLKKISFVGGDFAGITGVESFTKNFGSSGEYEKKYQVTNHSIHNSMCFITEMHASWCIVERITNTDNGQSPGDIDKYGFKGQNGECTVQCFRYKN